MGTQTNSRVIPFAIVLGVAGCMQACSAAEDGSPHQPLNAATAEASRVFAEPIVVSMKEVPVRGPTRATFPGGMRFLNGQIAACDEVPREAVKVYPKFVWKRPMHGRVRFGASLASDPSHVIESEGVTEFQFAMDASDPPEEAKDSDGRATRQALIFDRLYFDLNQDLDLTNDGVLKLARSPRPGSTGSLVFEDLVLHCDLGPELGKRPIRLTPLSSPCTTLTIGHLIHFLPKASRSGTFELGGRQYMAQIQENDLVCGRFDHPRVYLDISPLAGGRGGPAIAWGALGDWQRIAGRFCTVSATPMGDRLSIVPHQGETGRIILGSDRPDAIRMSECTLGSEIASLPVIRPGSGQPGPASLSREFQVPVGDYAVQSLSGFCGLLHITCRPLPNEQRDLISESDPYPVKIRSEKPYLLDFQPRQSVTVLNLTEPKSHKRGDTVQIRTVLAIPSLGLSLHTSVVAMRSEAAKKPPGDSVPERDSVVIRNARGDAVAQGSLRSGSFYWRVPGDLELSGSSETFSATTTFQTLGLYGPVEATFPIVIAAE